MAAFKQFDSLVHDLSLSINSAALEKDRSRAIADYQQMLNGCMACRGSAGCAEGKKWLLLSRSGKTDFNIIS
jgi:hypothetical protein